MLNRVIAATLGLLLPLVFAGAADAAGKTTRHGRPAHVQSATYKPGTHKPKAHRTSTSTHRRAPVAQTTGS